MLIFWVKLGTIYMLYKGEFMVNTFRIFWIELLMKLSFSKSQTCIYFDDVTKIALYGPNKDLII